MSNDVEYLSRDQISGLKTRDEVMKKLRSISADDYASIFFQKDKAPLDPPMPWEDFLKEKYDLSEKEKKQFQQKNEELENKLSKNKDHNKGADKGFMTSSWEEADFMSKKLGLTDTKQNTTEHNAPNKTRHEKTEFYHAAKWTQAGIIVGPTVIGGTMKFIGKKLRENGYEEAADKLEAAGNAIMKGGEYTANMAHNVLMIADYLMQPPTDNVVDLFANIVKASLPVKSNGKENEKEEPKETITPINQNQGPNSGNANNQNIENSNNQNIEASPKEGPTKEPPNVEVNALTTQAPPNNAPTQAPNNEKNAELEKTQTKPQHTVTTVFSNQNDGPKNQEEQNKNLGNNNNNKKNEAQKTANYVANAPKQPHEPNKPVSPSPASKSQGKVQAKNRNEPPKSIG